MKLKTQFVFIGGVLVAVAATAAWLDMQNIKLANEQLTAVHVVQRHMDADMKHDGMRGNVFSALVAAKSGDAEMLKASQEEVATMGAEFAQAVEDNLAADIPEDVRQQFEKIKKSVAMYASYSQRISKAAVDYDAAFAMLPQFEQVFGVLEEDQEKQSELILAWSSALQEKSNAYSHYLQIALGVLFLFSVGLPLFAMLAIFRPIEGMMQAMQKLSDGDTTQNIPYQDRSNEMGMMAKTVQVFKDNALRIKSMVEESERMKAENEKEKKAALNQMADRFETSVMEVVERVAESAQHMQTSAEQVTSIASDTKQKSFEVATTSTEAARITSQVAAAAEELTASIREISSQTQKSSQVASDAANRAQAAKENISELAEKSRRVGEIIKMITGIAEQINLLALNATIESARAGEAGRGFAVVASEVKNLANQVGKATDEIAKQIGEMQTATQVSVDSVMEILGVIGQMSDNTTAVAAAVEEQSAVTDEIARNVNRTSEGTQQITQNIATVQQGAEQTGTTANKVLDMAKSLGTQSMSLTDKVEEFLRTIRAA